jgi:hypothetical protein
LRLAERIGGGQKDSPGAVSVRMTDVAAQKAVKLAIPFLSYAGPLRSRQAAADSRRMTLKMDFPQTRPASDRKQGVQHRIGADVYGRNLFHWFRPPVYTKNPAVTGRVFCVLLR